MGQTPGLVTDTLSHGSRSGPHKPLKSCHLQYNTKSNTLPSEFLGNPLIPSHTSNSLQTSYSIMAANKPKHLFRWIPGNSHLTFKFKADFNHARYSVRKTVFSDQLRRIPEGLGKALLAALLCSKLSLKAASILWPMKTWYKAKELTPLLEKYRQF